jgi:GNAT superfamily N-acetyltransferase
MQAPEIRKLGPSDRSALELLLTAHADRSMFLQSNLLAAEFEDDGRPCSATYVGALAGGEVLAVAAHCWNDNVLLLCPEALAEVIRAVPGTSGRPVKGLVGPWEQVVEARGVLGLEEAPTAFCEREILFTLDLDALVVPQPLARGEVRCSVAAQEDLEALVAMRLVYELEAIGARGGPEHEGQARASMQRSIDDGAAWVLREQGREIVACSHFNARTPRAVQIGGVYTFPALRGRGFARAVVAGSLLAARERGVRRSVLFTGHHNLPAITAYEALGYRRTGDYGVVLLV